MLTPHGRFLVTSDLDRIDVDAAVGFLTEGVPWGRWRTAEQIRGQVVEAWRVVGAIDTQTEELVGFARAVSDGVMLAYLADVYVLPEFRGRGLSRMLMAEMIDNGPGRPFRWMLHTDTAHGLYEKFGFHAAPSTYMERTAPPG